MVAEAIENRQRTTQIRSELFVVATNPPEQGEITTSSPEVSVFPEPASKEFLMKAESFFDEVEILTDEHGNTYNQILSIGMSQSGRDMLNRRFGQTLAEKNLTLVTLEESDEESQHIGVIGNIFGGDGFNNRLKHTINSIFHEAPVMLQIHPLEDPLNYEQIESELVGAGLYVRGLQPTTEGNSLEVIANRLPENIVELSWERRGESPTPNIVYGGDIGEGEIRYDDISTE